MHGPGQRRFGNEACLSFIKETLRAWVPRAKALLPTLLWDLGTMC